MPMPAGCPRRSSAGCVELADVDAAVRRVLTLKEALGLFDDPYRGAADGLAAGAASPRIARSPARPRGARSCCSPTASAVLPLSADGGRIAVIGPLADAPADMLGPWAAAGRPEETVTLLEGLRAALPDARSARAGRRDRRRRRRAASRRRSISRARADVVVLCLGEARAMSGEAASRARPDLPGRQAELAKAVLDLGKPVVVSLSSGRPLMVPWLFERADAVLAIWFLGSEAGHAVGDILSGTHNPSGPAAGLLAGRRRPDPDLLCPAADRPAGRARPSTTRSQVPRPPGRAAVRVRSRAVLHALCLSRSARAARRASAR